ncbi:MAG: enediyne biosynthesis protein, partial [Actinomycetota bacterium]|nr:enediyne biosynthesis protein [Actinomycetota bacterium]
MAVAFLASAATCSSPATSTSATGPIAFSDATATEGLVEPLLGMYAHAAAYGDVNRDGWPDLFAGGFADYPDSYYQVRGSTGRSPDRLLLGGPDGFTVDTSFPSTFGRTAAAVFADFENTGYPDLVIVRHTLDDNSFGTPPTVLLRNDHGHFATPQPLADVAQGRSPAVLDYDDDGLPDLFISHDDYFGRTGTSVLLHNKGNAQFEDVTAGAGLSGIVAFGATAADLNGDRRPDLLVAETTPVHGPSSSPAARIFTNNGDATFHETPNAAFSWATYDFEDWATGITVADLNRDARPDVVIGHHFESTVQAHTTAPIRAYLNSGLDARGDPTFTDITSASGLPPLATKSPDVQIGDFDNDGWPDLITTASSANGSRPVVFRNTGLVDGVPQFVSPEGLGAAQYWLNAALADIDHDGRLDVFVTDFEPSRPSLL